MAPEPEGIQVINHIARRELAHGTWKHAQPRRWRLWMIRLPGKLTRHSGKYYLQLVRDHPLRARLLAALRLAHDLPPPLAA